MQYADCTLGGIGRKREQTSEKRRVQLLIQDPSTDGWLAYLWFKNGDPLHIMCG